MTYTSDQALGYMRNSVGRLPSGGDRAELQESAHTFAVLSIAAALIDVAEAVRELKPADDE